MAKIDPRIIIERARNTVQFLQDNLPCVIGRSRVADDPMADDPFDRCETAPDDRRLVPHDHHQANALHNLQASKKDRSQLLTTPPSHRRLAWVEHRAPETPACPG